MPTLTPAANSVPPDLLRAILGTIGANVKTSKKEQAELEKMLEQLQAPIGFTHIELVRSEADKNGQIILPDGMSLDEGITWLKRKRDAEMKEVEIRETIEGFPIDAARALNLAVKDKYGYQELLKIPGDFFTPDQPPVYITVPCDAMGNVEEVCVGRFSTPMIDGFMELTPNGNKSLIVTGTVRQKSMADVKALVALARKKLKTHSLYRGKAVKIDFTRMDDNRSMVLPQFWANDARIDSLLLNRDVEEQVRGALWNVLQFTDRCVEHGIPLKRGLLFEGEYGTGKTLCANITAAIAVANGWTFIYVANSNHLSHAYEFARRYEPAVVFAEDVDRPAREHQDGFTSQLSNVLDGVDAKKAKVILIMTTNHVSDIPAILLRPGRCDAAIHFATPDAETAGRLVEHYGHDPATGESLLDASCDIQAIGQRLAGKIPAIIREVVERAKLYGIERRPLRITTTDIIRTAELMEHHAKLCQPQDAAPTTGESFVNAFNSMVKDSTGDALKEAGIG
jgi:hypothetical protein